MKFRSGFVTNSSSSSFVCDVCGETASGWDLCLSEAEMYECRNGHVFCESEVLPISKKDIYRDYVKGLKVDEYYTKEKQQEELELIDNTPVDKIEEEINPEGDMRYEYPEAGCPVCALKVITNSDALKYFLKENEMSSDDLIEQINRQFGSYSKFKEFLGVK